MSSFCHEESQKHTIKTPRMHVDKNRIDAVSTTAVSLPKKLQPVRCKVSLALHLTYCTKSMCSRQMAVQRWPKHHFVNHFRPIDPLADSSQKSATKRSVLYHPLGTKEHSKTARVRNAATPASKDLLRHNSLPCLSGKSRAQAKRHLA